MATSTATRLPVNAKSRKPVVAELTLTVNSTPYVLIPIPPGPDNTAAFRLVKEGNADSVYDVARTVAGLVVCDCPSYEATYRDNGLATCKHGQALVLVGLLEAPSAVVRPAPAPIADGVDEPDLRDAYNDHRETQAARAVAPFDAELYRAQNAVVERRALWLEHRHLHTTGPMPTPAGPRLVDDDGTLLETSAETDARHEAEHAAKVAELMTGNPFLPACCPDDEPAPCLACLDADGPADGDWSDDDVITLAPDAELTMVEVIELEAARYRGWGTDLGDLLAERAESLVGQIKALDARTPEQFRDRRDAHLDCAMRQAEARLMAAACP